MTFAARAERCGELAAEGGTLARYFAFLQRLAEAQQRVEDASALARVLDELAQQFGESPSSVAAGALGRARDAAEIECERWMQAVMSGDQSVIPPDLMPFVGAAIQVLHRNSGNVRRGEADTQSPLCPSCNAVPVASILRSRDGVEGLRFLHCGICETEWNFPRVTCTHCGGNRDLSYYVIAGRKNVQAEACAACNAYLKIWHDAPADVLADDIATIELDALMGEMGMRRMALNPLFAFG